MPAPSDLLLAAFVLLSAALYSMVGHAGASGYLAVMALLGVSPEAMKPTALTLNILVAAIAVFRFHRAGHFSWRLFWPFALGSIPFSFAGGGLSLPGSYYRPVVGVVLLYSAFRLLALRPAGDRETHPFPLWAGLFAGAVIGLLSGLTGVGGGIFLSPLLLFMGWAETRVTAGVSSLFILVNSIAGLAGHLSSISNLPANLPLLAVAAAIGGWIGSGYGSRRLPSPRLRWLLALILAVAGLKLVLP